MNYYEYESHLTEAKGASTESSSSKKLLIYLFRESLPSFIMFCNTHQRIPVVSHILSFLFSGSKK